MAAVLLIGAVLTGTTPSATAAPAPPDSATNLGELGSSSGNRMLLSPAGDELFVGVADDFGWSSGSGRIEARDTITGATRVLVNSDGQINSPFTLWDITSAGDQMLISATVSTDAGNQQQLFMVDTATGGLTQITPTLAGNYITYGIEIASMSADGTVVGFRSPNDYLGDGFAEHVYTSTAGTLTKHTAGDGSALEWIHVLGDGSLLLPAAGFPEWVRIIDPAGSTTIVDLPTDYPYTETLYAINDPIASDSGAVIVWQTPGGRIYAWDRDVNGDGTLDDSAADSIIYEPTRGVAAYYGRQTGPPTISADGSLVAFTTEGTGPPCFSSRQPDRTSTLIGPSNQTGRQAVAGWSRTTHRLSYAAEIGDAIGINCGAMPAVTLTTTGDQTGFASYDDLDNSGLTRARRAWTAPVTAMPTRTITFTITNILECEDDPVPDELLCPGGGLDGGTNGDFFARTWLGSQSVVDTDLPVDTLAGDVADGNFVTISGQFLEAIPAVPLWVDVLDDDLANLPDPADISTVNNRTGSYIVLEPDTGDWRADGQVNQSWFRGDGDTEHESSGGHPIVMGFDITALEPNPALNDATPGDADGDGLLDGWELHGLTVIDILQDSPVTGPNPTLYTVIDPAWAAADPTVPDIFIENDWISDGTTSAVPVYNPRDNNTYADIVEAFALAPNPINLWIDTGELTRGATYTTPTGALTPTAGDYGVDFGGGNEVVIGTGDLANVDFVCSVHSGEFYGIKLHNFNLNRRWVFRYAINGTSRAYPGTDSCGRGGQAEIGGNDILNLRSDAVVMMHELGHSIGLRHGGDNNVHCKPNYVSVMNYAYDRQQGIPLDRGGFLLDFSPARYTTGGRSTIMPDIDEANLDERNILDPTNTEHLVRYSDGLGNTDTRPASVSLDYSGDRNDPPYEGGSTSVNNQDVSDGCDDTDSSEILTDHNDWAAVSIPFRHTDYYGDADNGVTEVSDDTGMVETDEEGDALRALGGRADLELTASVGPDDGDGSIDVGVSLRSLDTSTVVQPRILFELSDGVTVSPLPVGCTLDGAVLDCELEGIYVTVVPTPPVEYVLTVVVDPAAVDPTVTATAVSQDNPVSNDPDPTNNTTTLNLDGTSNGQPPVAEDDSEQAMVGDTITVDVLENDADPDDDLDETTLTIITPPTLGTATVVNTVDGPEIENQALPAGTDVVTYQVCDLTGNCDQATLTITVIDTGQCTVTGTAGNDTLTGTNGDDVICGLEGDDVIDGLGGNDLIFGGPGADIINGGDGDDTVIGNRGPDTINGGDGNDTLKGRRGHDTINGGNGNDLIRGGPGADVLNGDDGDDTIFAGKGTDELYGGPGADTLRARSGDDVLRGNTGPDLLYGGRGSDTLYGGRGHDSLYGRKGPDTLFGGPGNDLLQGGPGTDSGNGNTGTDQCFTETTTNCEN